MMKSAGKMAIQGACSIKVGLGEYGAPGRDQGAGCPGPGSLMEASVRMALERARVACTVKGFTTLGRCAAPGWRSSGRPRSGVGDILQALGRDDRRPHGPGKDGMLTMPMAIMVLTRPRPSTAEMKMASRMEGRQEDVHHTHDDPVHPALKIARQQAQDVAGHAPIPTAMMPTSRETRAVEDAAEDVPAVVVGAEPIVGAGSGFGHGHHLVRLKGSRQGQRWPPG